jgi:hypothetical protein
LSAGSTVGARNFSQTAFWCASLAFFKVLDQVVFAVTLVAARALDEGVAENLDVTGCFPDFARQDDAGVETDDIVAALHHVVPPLLLDVLLESDSEGAVIPCGARSSIDLTCLENEATVLREGNNRFKTCCGGHNEQSYRRTASYPVPELR